MYDEMTDKVKEMRRDRHESTSPRRGGRNGRSRDRRGRGSVDRYRRTSSTDRDTRQRRHEAGRYGASSEREQAKAADGK